jgi:hypothetical protein
VGNLPYNVEVVVLIIEDKITVDDTEETPYSISSPEEFDCQPNRGGTDKPLFLVPSRLGLHRGDPLLGQLAGGV